MLLGVRWRQPPLWYQSGGSAAALLDFPPSRTSGTILQQDPLRDQLVAQTIRLREVARFAGGVARFDEALDVGVEDFVAAREDVEDGIDLHQRGFDPGGVAGGEAAAVDGRV